MTGGTSSEFTIAHLSGSESRVAQSTLENLWLGQTGRLPAQLARYLRVSSLAFAIDAGSLYLLTEFARFPYLVSAAVAFLLGLATIYLLSRVRVSSPRTTEDSVREFVFFGVIGAVGLGLNEAVIGSVRERIHVHYLVAKTIAAGLVLAWDFGARRSLLLSRRPMPRFLAGLTPAGISSLSSAGMAVASLIFCLGVQGLSAAWSADFLAYPDEPSHFVGAVMIRDWLVSGRWFSPLEFARNYYDHYPFFAVGYWPPLFSIVTGFWLLITGVGRVQALLIPAAFAAGTGWLVYKLVRQRAGIAASFCAGALYLSLPPVRHWTCAVMVDHMTAFLCIATAVCLLRSLERPDLRNGILCAVCCACSSLSKYSAAYTIALPFLAILVLRRFDLLKKPSLLIQPVLFVAITGPWILWTREMAFYGLPTERGALEANRIASFLLETFRVFPPVLMAIVVLGLIALLLRPRAWRVDLVVLGLLCGGHLTFLVVSPVGAEQRYLLVPAAAILVASFAGWSAVAFSIPRSGWWASAIPVRWRS